MISCIVKEENGKIKFNHTGCRKTSLKNIASIPGVTELDFPSPDNSDFKC